MTNQTDLVRVKVRLNQVISNGTGGPGSNVPTGLTMTNNGSLVTTAPGTITSGNQNFSLESPITKDVTTPWEAGSNKGGLLTSTSAQTEKLNAFVISTGVVHDIAFTFDDTPTLPTGYNLYAKIGHVLLNEGAITELWPTKDLGTSWVDNDIYTAINETNTRVTANSEELTNVKADIVDINTSVEGLDTATAEIQAKLPDNASAENKLATQEDLAKYLPLTGGSVTGQTSISTTQVGGVALNVSGKSMHIGDVLVASPEVSNPRPVLISAAQIGDADPILLVGAQTVTVSGQIVSNPYGVALWSSNKGTANGVASLDANAKIPAAQIPVDGTTITVNAEGNLVSAGGSGGDAMVVVKLTQAEYDALNPKDPSTIYAIKMEEE